jgi:hypothetical protein
MRENMSMDWWIGRGILDRVFSIWSMASPRRGPEVCSASSRLLVQDGIKSRLLRLVAERADTLRPGGSTCW